MTCPFDASYDCPYEQLLGNNSMTCEECEVTESFEGGEKHGT